MNDANLHPTDEALLSWVSGEMIGERAQVLEAHVAACPACGGRLADECALDVVMHAAGDLAADADVVELVPAARRPRIASGGWRHVAAAAAGFALLLMAGRGALSEAPVDAVDPELGSPAVVIADGPASWADDARNDDAICELSFAPQDDEDICAEPGEGLVAMAGPNEPTLWSVMAVSMDGGDDGPCTTPVDTGESLTCDDWLSTDDFSG